MKQDSIRIAADSQAKFNNNTAFCIGTGRMGLALQQEYQQQLAMAQAESLPSMYEYVRRILSLGFSERDAHRFHILTWNTLHDRAP